MPYLRFTGPIGITLAFLVTTPIVAAQDDAGPMVGHVDTNSARLLIRRGAQEKTLRLRVIDATGQVINTKDVTTEKEHDYVAKFHVTGLESSTRYQYRISEVMPSGEKIIADGEDLSFQTSSPNRQGESVTLCFTSCVDIEENPMWDGMRRLRPDMLFLMGDTPYIDSTDLNRVRSRHRSFLNIPVFADVMRNTPTVGIWDDHDFGLNNGNGHNMRAGKSATRQGFVEYRAHNQFGTGTEGVYHNVDLGMIEVFLLDPRYFSQTEPSPVDSQQPTCFGHQQWKWLLSELKNSKAPFKVLAMGAIWQDKKNAETDDMFTYWYERDALLDFVAEYQISGVVLLGGDIHVSRHLVHPLRVGYDLHDFIISPGHERVISALDVYHPSLRWSLIEGHQFLSLTADGTTGEPRLVAKFRQAEDTINRTVTIPFSKLTPGSPKGLSRGLRAHWSFDSDFKNSSSLGDYANAKPNGGAELIREGRHGGAVAFERGRQQFLSVSHNPLDDNSGDHTFALWCRPNTLPRHGTSDRCFLFESTAQGEPSGDSAWHLSLGLRASHDPDKVNLQLYTHTLVPASKPEAAPTARSQGGFDFLIDRKELSDWVHITCLFDSKTLTLYLNGKKRITHTLPVAGPASEFGGLIIGGHRAGTGRNFDGAIDDLAIWSRLLSPREIGQLMQTSLTEETLSR